MEKKIYKYKATVDFVTADQIVAETYLKTGYFVIDQALIDYVNVDDTSYPYLKELIKEHDFKPCHIQANTINKEHLWELQEMDVDLYKDIKVWDIEKVELNDYVVFDFGDGNNSDYWVADDETFKRDVQEFLDGKSNKFGVKNIYGCNSDPI